MLEITVPRLAPGLNGKNGLIRMHWSTYKKIKESWIWFIKADVLPNTRKFNQCKITIIRFYATHEMDLDNLYSTAKIPLDALKCCGIFPDDNPRVVTSLSMQQQKVKKRKQELTRILIGDTNGL